MELPPSAIAPFGSSCHGFPSDGGRAGTSNPDVPVISITSLYPLSNPVMFLTTIFSGNIDDRFARRSFCISFLSSSKILVSAPTVATFGTFRPTVSFAILVAGT